MIWQISYTVQYLQSAKQREETMDIQVSIYDVSKEPDLIRILLAAEIIIQYPSLTPEVYVDVRFMTSHW